MKIDCKQLNEQTTNNECTRCAQTNQMIFSLINFFSRCIVNENLERDVCDCCLFRHRDSKCSRSINYELDLIESMRFSRRQYQSFSTLDQRFDTRIFTRQNFESIVDVFVYLFVRVNRRQATSFETSTSSQISNSKTTKKESLFIFDENDNVLENENDSTLAWISTSSNNASIKNASVESSRSIVSSSMISSRVASRRREDNEWLVAYRQRWRELMISRASTKTSSTRHRRLIRHYSFEEKTNRRRVKEN